jgi:hypothetical protein
MAGVPIKTVQDLMGHKTIQMTARYAHLSPDYLQNAVEMIVGANSHQTATGTHRKRTATRTATDTKKATGSGGR